MFLDIALHLMQVCCVYDTACEDPLTFLSKYTIVEHLPTFNSCAKTVHDLVIANTYRLEMSEVMVKSIRKIMLASIALC